MAKDIKKVIATADYTLMTDALGAVALVVMLFVGLSLPGTF